MATNYGKKLNELRLKAGFKNLREFSRLVGVTHSNIHNIEIGKVIDVRQETWNAILKPLGLTYGEFVSMADETAGKIYPVINMVKCSFDDLLEASDKGFPTGFAEEYESGPAVPDPNSFYVKASGKSMIDKGISEGDLLLVTPNIEFEDNKPNLVIIDNNGSREAMVKITKREGSLVKLTSAAFPKWEDRLIDPEEKKVIIYRIYGIFHKN